MVKTRSGKKLNKLNMSQSSSSSSEEELEELKITTKDTTPLTNTSMAKMLNSHMTILNKNLKTIRKEVKDVKRGVKARMDMIEGKYENLSHDLVVMEAEGDEQKKLSLNMLERLEDLENENSLTKNKVDRMALENNILHRKMREKNLIIHNLRSPITAGLMIAPAREDTRVIVSRFIANNNLWEGNKIEQVLPEIEEAFRFGQPVMTRPRSILVKFKNKNVRNTVMRNAKIKGKENKPGDPYLMDDLSPADQYRRKECNDFILMKQEKEEKAYFRAGRVYGETGPYREEEINEFIKENNEETQQEMRTKSRRNRSRRERIETTRPRARSPPSPTTIERLTTQCQFDRASDADREFSDDDVEELNAEEQLHSLGASNRPLRFRGGPRPQRAARGLRRPWRSRGTGRGRGLLNLDEPNETPNPPDQPVQTNEQNPPIEGQQNTPSGENGSNMATGER